MWTDKCPSIPSNFFSWISAKAKLQLFDWRWSKTFCYLHGGAGLKGIGCFGGLLTGVCRPVGTCSCTHLQGPARQPLYWTTTMLEEHRTDMRASKKDIIQQDRNSFVHRDAVKQQGMPQAKSTLNIRATAWSSAHRPAEHNAEWSSSSCPCSASCSEFPPWTPIERKTVFQDSSFHLPFGASYICSDWNLSNTPLPPCFCLGLDPMWI